MTDQTITDEKVREAREWAQANIDGGYFHGGGRSLAAAEVVLALTEEPFPTLADMTPEEREACKWMQADITDRGTVVIINADAGNGKGCIITSQGYFSTANLEEITPRPDLPRMVWPAQEPRTSETPPAETQDKTSSTIPRNSDPQPGEAWLVMDDEGIEFKGVLDNIESWMGTEPDGKPRSPSIDRCTPIARMVPETPRKTLVTEEDYRDAPVGTVITYPSFFDDGVEADWIDTAVKYGDGHWRSTGSVGYDDSSWMSGIPRTVLWEPEA